MSSIEDNVLQEIEQLLTKLNQKLDRIIMVQAWLNNFKSDVQNIKKEVTPGVI